MLEPDSALLVEIEESIGHIRSFIENFDKASFLEDRRTSAAVAMYILVIGESAARLSKDTRDEAPEIAWEKIVNLRNRIAHGYRSIDREMMWSITQADLTPLSAAVARMLAARGE